MELPPRTDLVGYKPAGKLPGRKAMVTGADSGVGRTVALAFALEGADVAIVCNENDGDAEETKSVVKAQGCRCLVLKSDARDPAACRSAVAKAVTEFGKA